MAMKKVLVVDDEPDFLNLLKDTLSARGFDVMDASNAVEAGLMLSGQRKPDIILMDMKMAGINGLEACAAMKRNINTRDIPIIVVSAVSDQDAIAKARKIGVAEYLIKPVQIEELIGKIKEILKIT